MQWNSDRGWISTSPRARIHALRREGLCLKKLPSLTINFRHETLVR